MSKQILIDSRLRVAILEEKEIKYFYHYNMQYNIGDIFIGRIVQKNDNLHAFFIDFGDIKNGFMPYKNIYYNHSQYKIGDTLLVQMKKEIRSNKGAYLTNLISLSSKYFVYIPYSKVPGFHSSKKLTNDQIKSIKSTTLSFLKENNTIIARTESGKQNNNILQSDLKNLIKRWTEIQNTDMKQVHFVSGTNPLLNILYNHIDEQTIIYAKTEKILNEIKPSYPNNAVYIDLSISLNQYLIEATQSRIILKSGAMISIDLTEAGIMIDVNSFKAKNLSINDINHEAAYEILTQIKLKNLSGLIMIDFISDIDSKDLLSIIECELKKDKAKTEVAFINQMYICIISRERTGKNIWEIIGTKCNICDGYGLIDKLSKSHSFTSINHKKNLHNSNLILSPQIYLSD